MPQSFSRYAPASGRGEDNLIQPSRSEVNEHSLKPSREAENLEDAEDLGTMWPR